MVGSKERVKERAMRDAVIDTAMSLIAKDGWGALTVDHLIGASGVTRQEFHAEFDSLPSVMMSASRRLNSTMLEAAEDFEKDDTVREKLFALIMARFDAAEPWKDALKRIRDAVPRDPLLAATVAQIALNAASCALEAADVPARGPIGFARCNALVATVILPTARVWFRDESADLAKTMAALDKALERTERLVGRLHPFSGRLSSALRPKADNGMDYGSSVRTDDEPGPESLNNSKQQKGAARSTSRKAASKPVSTSAKSEKGRKGPVKR